MSWGRVEEGADGGGARGGVSKLLLACGVRFESLGWGWTSLFQVGSWLGCLTSLAPALVLV